MKFLVSEIDFFIPKKRQLLYFYFYCFKKVRNSEFSGFLGAVLEVNLRLMKHGTVKP